MNTSHGNARRARGAGQRQLLIWSVMALALGIGLGYPAAHLSKNVCAMKGLEYAESLDREFIDHLGRRMHSGSVAAATDVIAPYLVRTRFSLPHEGGRDSYECVCVGLFGLGWQWSAGAVSAAP
jgi:hypothetical protein